MAYHRKLGLDRHSFERIRDNDFVEDDADGTPMQRLPDYHNRLERGTVLIEGTVVRGFPKVPRTLVLEEGISRYFDGEVVVEEKMDGYNVRLARIDGETYAFTRSGLVCPFTTHEARRMLEPEAFFDAHPDLMICVEMVGPENPYTAHDYDDVDSLAPRVFDVRDRESGEPLAVEERRDLVEAHGFPQVPLLGRHDLQEAPDGVDDAIRQLDAEGREGVVMKSVDGDRQLKYTTSAANQGDLAYAFSMPFDYGRDFMFRRLLREAFQAHERAEDGERFDDRAAAVGEAVLEPMRDAIATVDEGGVVGERHTVRAAPDVVEALLDHLRDQHVALEVERDEREGDDRVVTFLKRVQSTNDSIRAYLDGEAIRH
jgi:putative ATP-dependent DNA ligase